jgi:putative oxidoreductase
MSIRNRLEPVAVTLLRISTGVIMSAHGWGKLQNLSGTIEMFTHLGLPSPKIAAYLAVAGELGGGLGLLVGLLTPIAAFGILCVMTVAITQVHWHNGLMAKDNGFEYPLTLFMVSLFFIVRGAGPVSLDALFCRKKKEQSSM